MKKRLLCLMLSIFMILPLAVSCGTTETPTEAPTEEPSVEPVGDPIDIVVNGKSDYVIIRGKSATEAEINAAIELQSYIKQITGCQIPIATDSREESDYEIIVGKTTREESGEFDRDELGNDGFIIKTVDSKIYLVGGGSRGTVYAVYEFLEAYLGCRFYTPTIENIPSTKNITVNAIEEDKQIPVFEYRSVFWAEYRRSSDISVKRKLSGGPVGEDWGGSVDYAAGLSCHTYLAFVPPATYFDSHPEYYRMTQSGTRDKSQLCLTNPEVLQIVIDGVRSYLTANPNAELISVSQEDTGSQTGACFCENCSKIDQAAGAYSASIIEFVNAIARDIKDDFPNVMIHTFAYRYSRTAPVGVTPEDNVVVQLCTIESCFSHPLDAGCPDVYDRDSSTTGDSNTFYDDLKAWAQLSENLYIWDYTTSYFNYNVTFPNFDTILANAKIFADNNVIGVLEQGAYQTTNGEFCELRSYLLAKVLWDPYMTEEEFYGHMDDFLEGVYGDGWTYIREYIDIAEAEGENYHFGTYAEVDEIFPTTIVKHEDKELPANLTVDMILDYENTDWTPYVNYYTEITQNIAVTKGEELFAKAIEAAKTDEQKARLDKAYIQVEYAKSYYYYQLYMKYLRQDMAYLVKNVLHANTEKHELTESQITKYGNRIASVVSKIYTQKYVDYNTFLSERIDSYGIRVREGYINQSRNLRNIPSQWHM